MIADKVLCFLAGVQLVCGIYFLTEKQYIRAVLAFVVCAYGIIGGVFI